MSKTISTSCIYYHLLHQKRFSEHAGTFPAVLDSHSSSCTHSHIWKLPSATTVCAEISIHGSGGTILEDTPVVCSRGIVLGISTSSLNALAEITLVQHNHVTGNDCSALLTSILHLFLFGSLKAWMELYEFMFYTALIHLKLFCWRVGW